MGDVARKFIKFSLSGGLATVVHILIVVMGVEIFNVGAEIATGPAFLAALGVSYAINHQWTFGAKGEHFRYFPRFALVAILGLLLNVSIMYFCLKLIGINYIAALGVVVVVIPICSFFLNLTWSFHR